MEGSIDFEGLTQNDVAWIFDECHTAMRESLNVDAIWPHLCREHLLTAEEQQTLSLQTSTPSVKTDKVKLLLRNKGVSGLQAFLKTLNETTDGTNHGHLVGCFQDAILKRKAYKLNHPPFEKHGRARDFQSGRSEFNSEPYDSFDPMSYHTPTDFTPSFPVSYAKFSSRQAGMNPEQKSDPVGFVTTPVLGPPRKRMTQSLMSYYSRGTHSPGHFPRKVVSADSETAMMPQGFGTSLSNASSKGAISMQIGLNFGIPGIPIQESIPITPTSYSHETFDENDDPTMTKPVVVVGDKEFGIPQQGSLNPSQSYHSINPLTGDPRLSRQDPTASLVPSSLLKHNDESKLTPLLEESTSHNSSVGKETTTLKQPQPQTSVTSSLSHSQQHQERTHHPTTTVVHTADAQIQCTEEEHLSIPTSPEQETDGHTKPSSVAIKARVSPHRVPLVNKPTRRKGTKTTSKRPKKWSVSHTFYVNREKWYRAICKPDLKFHFREKTIIPTGVTRTFFFFPKEIGPTLYLDVYPCGLIGDNEAQFSTLRVTLDLKSAGDKCRELADTCCELMVKVTTSDFTSGEHLNTASKQKRLDLEQGVYSMQFDVNRMVSHNSVTHEASCDNLKIDVFAKLTSKKYKVRESQVSEEGYTNVDIERLDESDPEEAESIPEELNSSSDTPEPPSSPSRTQIPIHKPSRHTETISVPVEVEDHNGASSQFPSLPGTRTSPIQSPSLPSSGTFRSPIVKRHSTRPPPPFAIPPLQETVIVAERIVGRAGESNHDALVLPQQPQTQDHCPDQPPNTTDSKKSQNTQESTYFTQGSGDEYSECSTHDHEYTPPYVKTVPRALSGDMEVETHQASAPPLDVVRPGALHLECQDKCKEPETQFSVDHEQPDQEIKPKREETKPVAKSIVIPKPKSRLPIKVHNFRDFLLLWSPQLPRVSKYYQCAESIAHVPFIGPVTVFACGYHGGQFHSDIHDITVTIPKGAIPEGLVVNFELAVSLYGPFKFHKGTRPISPILWLCPQEDFEFQRPIKIVLPHALATFSKGDEESCTIQKATEYSLFLEDNLFNFSDIGSDVHVKKPHYFSRGGKQFVEFEILHCCHYCLARKEWSPEQVRARGYHLHTIKSKQELIYSITYYLGSCKQALMEQYPKEQGYVLQESKRIHLENQENGQFEITFSREFHNLGVEMVSSNAVMAASDVDFYREDRDYKELEHDHKNREYPPRVWFKFKEFPLPMSLKGCIRDEELTTGIIPYVDLSKDQQRPDPIALNEWTQLGRLTEKDHFKIYQYLKTLDENDIILLGQALGLLRSTLKKMKNMTTDMIDAWLNQAEHVLTTSGCPTWESLCVALTEISQPGIAVDIREREISAEMAALFQSLSETSHQHLEIQTLQPNGHIPSAANSGVNHYISREHSAGYNPLNTQRPPLHVEESRTRTESTSSATLTPSSDIDSNGSITSSPPNSQNGGCAIN